MKKEMLINVLQPEECRIAIVEDGVLEELYVERASQESYVGNIYKGRIVNIEPSIQAAFVDFGIGRNGFLHVSDVDPVYFKHLLPKDVLARFEAGEAEDDDEDGPPPSRDRGGRGDRGDRGGRGDRRDRDRDRDRGPRVARPESAVTVNRVPSPPPDVEDEEDAGFGEGLIEGEEYIEEEVEVVEGEEFEEVIEVVEDAEPEEEGELFEPEPIAEPVAKAPPVSPPARPASPAPADEDDAGFGEGLDLAPVTPAETEEEPASEPETNGFGNGPATTPTVEKTAPSEPEENGFGEGLVPLSPATDSPAAEEPRVEPEVLAPTSAAVEVTEPEVVAETSTEAATEAPAEAEKVEKKPRTTRTRTRTKSKETVEGEEPAPAAESESKEEKKPKARRTRKKADEETKSDGDLPPDAEPRVMGGAEHRTHPDDEPEIKPFFDEGEGDFDVAGPNDRFAPQPAVTHEEYIEGEEIEGIEGVDYEIVEEIVEGEEVQGVSPPPRPAPAYTEEDDDEFAPPIRSDDRGGRGDRDRGGRGGRRDGGGRSGDGRSRGRDRRGDRPGGAPANGGPRPGGGRDRNFPRMPIEKIFKRGQEVIVQVIKEGIGTKGPTLSTFVSIAGRYLVLMPSLNRVGVSRKIEDRDARHRLRDIMTRLNPPKGVGFIVRTAATDRNEQELQNDLAYLLRLWQVVVRRLKRVAAPVEIYRESDMITRTIRDIFTNDIDTIWVDEERAFAHASEFLQIVMPRFASRIRYHADTEPLFNRYGVEEEIQKINNKRIDLPEGGSIIIEQTEALVAIDVNSGTFRAENNAEETAFQMNMRAAKEIARQLRLRDLGGVIVNDFIDMRSETHRRRVEDTLRDALKRDRARTKILRISQFGIIEMTRQRMQPSLKKRIYNDCAHCKGTGYVKTQETMGIEVMRLLQMAAHRSPQVSAMTVTVHTDAAFYLLNRKRKEIAALEERARMEVQIQGVPGVSPDLCEFTCYDANGNEFRLFQTAPPRVFRSGGPRSFPDRR